MDRGTPVRHKDYYTTGEVARTCRVSIQTVIRWVDQGVLNAFRVSATGRQGARRISHDELEQFMRRKQLPMDRLETGIKRVVVVDDDEAIIEMFLDLVGQVKGIELRTARCGWEAGTVVSEFKPHVLLVDYMLPTINGTEVCRYVRSRPEGRNMTIFLMSGVVDPEEIGALSNVGADDFFRKPFDIRAVLDRILSVDVSAAGGVV